VDSMSPKLPVLRVRTCSASDAVGTVPVVGVDTEFP